MKVSVCMVTYNHENYIAEAIQSVLMQETDFPFEIVIGEDCSTDGTRGIVVEYHRRYPQIIRPLLQRTNVGVQQNFAAVLEHATGEYIAILDGDDYWTSRRKLQLQCAYLDEHPELSMCFHAGTSLDTSDADSTFDLPPMPAQNTYSLTDLLMRKNFMFTHSTLLRRKYFEHLPELSRQVSAMDFTFYVVSAQHGDIGYIPENMCVHRRHNNSTWFSAFKSDPLRIQLKTAEDFEAIDRYYHYQYARQMRVAEYYYYLTRQSLESGNIPGAQECLRGVMRTIRADSDLNLDELRQLASHLGVPQPLV